MLHHPRLQPHLHAAVVPDAGVFVLSELQQIMLQGRLYELVVPLVDGRPIEDICSQLRGEISAAQVFYTVNKLEQKGFLYEDGVAKGSDSLAIWSLQGVEPRAAASRFVETTVSLKAIHVEAAPLRSLLEEMQIRLKDDGDLTVVLTDHYLRGELQNCNTEALRTGRPWLLIKPVGSWIWIGPLFRPGRTACWECLAIRMRANSPVMACLESLRCEPGLAALGGIQTPATLAAAWGLAAQSIAAWVANGKELPQLEGTIQTFDLRAFASEAHQLLKQPTCPNCGKTPTEPDFELRPIVLHSCAKIYTADGGYRAMTPQDTLNKYSHHVSPICGTVSMLERWFEPDEGSVMHVFVSGHNIARAPRDVFNLKRDLRNSSAGKGTTELQARASALGEALERYSGTFRGDEPRRKARFIDLGDAAIYPNRCMQFSERQYRDRKTLNSQGYRYAFVPQPFDPECEIEWTLIWSLTHQTIRYLPTDFCYFSYPVDRRADFCPSCSNGNAAGTSMEDAILQGFLELVERDAVALWWYNRIQLPGVDLDSFGEPYLRRLRDLLNANDRDLWALDLTSDLGIPVFGAFSHRLDGPPEQILFGFGAHLDPKIALLRSVTELNQMLTHVWGTSPGEPNENITDKEVLQWLETATLASDPYLAPGSSPRRTASDYTVNCTDDLRDDVLFCQRLVENRGFEFLVHDQTRPEIGLPVVKVIVPGLRHFWPRFAPGRLYDVPVELGHLPHPLTEEQLNPTPMFL
jgi:oxazoline/thiazoline synthase